MKSLRRDSTQGADLSRFWRRSLVSGVAARPLGQWAKLQDPEALFLAAMLHAGSNAEQMLQMEAEDVQSTVTKISQALDDILEQAQSALLTTITEAVEQIQGVPSAADKLTFFAPSTVDKV